MPRCTNMTQWIDWQRFKIKGSQYLNIFVIIQMRQDQKQTPNKYASRSYKKRMIDQALSKDLLCPFMDTFSPALFPAYTPLRKQPEYLLSPSPIKKDLFSQLLGTQTKQNSPVDQSQQPIEEENMSMSDISSESDNSMIEQCSSENEANWSDENGIKKRKRKSTAQIKLLKQELDGEMNWTKQKINKMAQITGLSQSQVYKWCWDQKKKQNKGKEEQSRNFHDKRKLIKKNVSFRTFQESKRARGENSEDEEKQNIKQQYYGQNNMRRTMTKPKSATGLADAHETEKKVNKRLIFY